MAQTYKIMLQKVNHTPIVEEDDTVRCVICKSPTDSANDDSTETFYFTEICIFTIDSEYNTFKHVVTFHPAISLPSDEVHCTMELETAPRVMGGIPREDIKTAPALFWVLGWSSNTLYIRDDVADIHFDDLDLTGTVNANTSRWCIDWDVAIRRKITIKSLGVTVTSAEETLREYVQKRNNLYQSFSEKFARAETIPEAQGIYKEMEGILADIKSLIEVWASGSIDRIRAFNHKTMNSWKHSAEARAMGVPNVGDHLFGIVKGISFHPCVIPVCITSVNGEQIEFAHASDVNNPHGFAYITYTVPTEQFKGCLFKSEDDAANYLAGLS